MIALTTGVNQLTAGVVYALPGFPCQIFGTSLYFFSKIGDGGHYLWLSGNEPGVYIKGGYITGEANTVCVIKRHTIGTNTVTAVNYKSVILEDKPSYYWRLNEPFLYGTAEELMQHLYGTISGGVTVNQPGALADDKCMVFDGVSGKITTATTSIPIPFSVEFWIRTVNVGGHNPIISFGTGAVERDSLFFRVVNANLIIDVRPNGVAQNISSSIAITDNQWHHVAWVFPGGLTVRLYIDGVERTLNSQLLTAIKGITQEAVEIGWVSAWPLYFTGSLDEVAIYPYALSPSQISQHYLARSPYPTKSYASKVIASGPSAYWRLDETYGTVAKDIIGNTNGTISGGVVLNGESGMTFDGVDDKIATALSVVAPLPFTVEGWINTTNNTSERAWVCGMDGLTAYAGIYEGKLFSYWGAGGAGLKNLADGKWHHGVIVWSSTSVKFYADGVFDGEITTNPPTSSLNHRVEIGYRTGGGPVNAWQGSIDEVAIYPRALSASEILDHYRAR